MDGFSAVTIMASASRQMLYVFRITDQFFQRREADCAIPVHLQETKAHPTQHGCLRYDFHVLSMDFKTDDLQVNTKLDVPLNAVLTSTAISCLLSLINIGSTVAFNNLVSLTNGVLMVSYSVCVGCFVWRRLSGQPMLPSRFNLGVLGLPINLLAMAFLAVVFVMVSSWSSHELMHKLKAGRHSSHLRLCLILSSNP